MCTLWTEVGPGKLEYYKGETKLAEIQRKEHYWFAFLTYGFYRRFITREEAQVWIEKTLRKLAPKKTSPKNLSG